MAIETIAAAAITYLGTSLINNKGAEKAKEETTIALWNWIRPIFLKDEEKKAQLEKFETEPTKPENQKAVIAHTQQHLQEHPEQLEQLKILLQKAQSAHPERMGDVYNFGTVEKQVNNPNIGGDFNM